MNIALLSDIKANILAVPETFRMESWFRSDINAPCGTTGCIAGHAVAIGCAAKTLKEIAKQYRADFLYSPTPRYAGELLQLDDQQRSRLFYLSSWPFSFRLDYCRAENAPERVQVTARRIDHFIKTKGRE